MAWDQFYDLPDNFRDKEAFHNDAYVQGLTEFLFGHDHNDPDRNDGKGYALILEELQSYLYNEYDIDLDDSFDWENWREWYSSE